MSGLTLGEMNRDEGRSTANGRLVVIPLGSLEQHGPHLPVATDTILVTCIAYEAARLVESDLPIVIAPALPYGVSRHHLPYGGTSSLDSGHFHSCVIDVCSSLIESGFSHIFLLNGHGGNHELARVVPRDVVLERGGRVGAGSYWHMAESQLLKARATHVGEVPGHAGAFETSLMLATRPDLVTQPLPVGGGGKPPYPVFSEQIYQQAGPEAFRAPAGFSDDPSAASATLGKQCVEICAKATAEVLRDFFGARDR